MTLNGAMPQGSWLGPLCFIIYLHDMPAFSNIRVHKYIDDSTISENINNGKDSNIQKAMENIESWSTHNKMVINQSKTKEMIIHTRKSELKINPIIINSETIERVENFKLLGIWLSSNLSWNFHIDKLIAKASQRIYFLKQLKRSGAPTKDLVTYYKAVVRSIMEYGCQVWNSGLTQEHITKLESLQKRSTNIILPGEEYGESLNRLKLEPLNERREKLGRKLFKDITHPDNKLHYLLPPVRTYVRNTRANNNSSKKFIIPKAKNNRYKSNFITHSLFNYQ
jgi:hypothetical protein